MTDYVTRDRFQQFYALILNDGLPWTIPCGSATAITAFRAADDALYTRAKIDDGKMVRIRNWRDAETLKSRLRAKKPDCGRIRIQFVDLVPSDETKEDCELLKQLEEVVRSAGAS